MDKKHYCIRGFKCMYFVHTVEGKGLCTYLQEGPDTEIDLTKTEQECIFLPSKKYVHVSEEPSV